MQDGLESDIRQRLANIERKINALIHRHIPVIVTEPEQAGLVKNQFFGSRTFAQHGDDLLALILFHSLKIDKPSYLDIGAHHPFQVSNTGLMYLRGSRGVNIEANPLLIDAFRMQRPEDVTLNYGVAGEGRPRKLTYHSFGDDLGLNTFDPELARQLATRFGRDPATTEIPTITIAEVLDRYCDGKFPDFLSIDVEGMETEVLSSIDYGGSLPMVIAAEGNDEAARASISDLLTANGFRRLLRVAENLFFIRADLFDRVV